MNQHTGSVLLGRGFKTRRTVSSGLQATPTGTGTNEMCTESCLQPESEHRVSALNLDRDGPKEDDI